MFTLVAVLYAIWMVSWAAFGVFLFRILENVDWTEFWFYGALAPIRVTRDTLRYVATVAIVVIGYIMKLVLFAIGIGVNDKVANFAYNFAIELFDIDAEISAITKELRKENAAEIKRLKKELAKANNEAKGLQAALVRVSQTVETNNRYNVPPHETIKQVNGIAQPYIGRSGKGRTGNSKRQ